MAVPEQTPYKEYTANGSTTSFALGFICDSKNDLIVLVDGVAPPVATWSLIGANAVFTTAPASGKKITLQRQTKFERNTNFQSNNNSFRPETINKDIDRVWLKLQELGVADMLLKIYVDRLHDEQKDYIDDKDQLVRNVINDLRNYVNQQDNDLANSISNLRTHVDQQDNSRNSYFENLISQQGVSLQQLDSYYKHLLQGIANIAAEKGWLASLVVDKSGKSQQQINDSIAVKFLTANEVGLVIWPAMKQPPYSQKDYEDAYNNGINFVRSLERLNSQGYSEVIFERFNGILPFCYSNLSGSSVSNLIGNSCHAILTGTNNLKVRGNKNQIHVIFDSVNRSPYDKATSLLPYQLRGCVIGLEHNTDLEITGFELVGDQYTRSWVSGEQNTEHTAGIRLGKNNINTKIDIIGRGFRGDAVSGQPRGDVLYSLDDNWSSGGLNTTTGAEIVEAGSYRSPRMDLQGKTIYRNAVQIATTGYLRAAEFRDDLLNVFFFDNSGAFISTEKARQCDFIYLPKNCRYIQFVAYGDERTEPVVGYGLYLLLVTGSSDTALVQGEYYANHRGAVSNLCGNTTVDAYIHDNGTAKYGFPHYSDSTRYGVNFEDVFVSKLTVRGRIENGIQAILCNARSLDVKAVIKNMTLGGVGAYDTFNSEISGCEFSNVGVVFFVRKTTTRKKDRIHNINNNNIKNSNLSFDISDNPDVFIGIANNIYANTTISLIGNGSNFSFDGNKVLSVLGRYVEVFGVMGAISTTGNTVIRSTNVGSDSIGWGGIRLGGKSSGNNLVQIDQPGQRLIPPSSPNDRPRMNGTEIILNQAAILYQVIKSGIWSDFVDNRSFEGCTLNGGSLHLGSDTITTTQANLNLVFNGGGFKNGAHLVYFRRESGIGSTNTITIKNAIIDLSVSTYLIRILFTPIGSLNIKFLNCTFISDTPKSIAFIQGQTANVVSESIGCRYINVTNTDEITVVS